MTTQMTSTEPDVDAAATTFAVRAHQLQLDAGRGRVFGPVDLAIPVGSLSLVTGPAGVGKTSLLLTIAGRLKPNRHSDLEVLGRRLPSQARGVQVRSAAVGIHGLDDLDEEVTVAATIRERQAWLAPWYRIVRAPDDAGVAEVCSPVFGDSPAPRARQLVHELGEADNLLLRIALAMQGRPELVVIDDIDALHDTDGRRRVWEALQGLSAEGTTVVVTASSAGELSRLGWAVLPHHISLSNH
jgi:ABC-type multidrug transport system ATPase subunit